LLLIFFVCTASFQVDEAMLPVLLPASDTVAKVTVNVPLPELDRLVIKLQMRDGHAEWSVDGRPFGKLVELRRMLRAVAAIDAQLSIVLDVDGNVPMSDAIDLYDACRLSGFTAIQFAASEGV
ncbi:MAG: ExbD/TolR family protein, partial [Pirellulales bacterium]